MPGRAPADAAPRVAACRAERVGCVRRYFPRAGAAALCLERSLAVGDVLHVRGHTTDLVVRVESLERDGRPVDSGGPGETVGLAVPERVRRGDRVYRVVP
jgi:putative protease